MDQIVGVDHTEFWFNETVQTNAHDRPNKVSEYLHRLKDFGISWVDIMKDEIQKLEQEIARLEEERDDLDGMFQSERPTGA